MEVEQFLEVRAADLVLLRRYSRVFGELWDDTQGRGLQRDAQSGYYRLPLINGVTHHPELWHWVLQALRTHDLLSAHQALEARWMDRRAAQLRLVTLQGLWEAVRALELYDVPLLLALVESEVLDRLNRYTLQGLEAMAPQLVDAEAGAGYLEREFRVELQRRRLIHAIVARATGLEVAADRVLAMAPRLGPLLSLGDALDVITADGLWHASMFAKEPELQVAHSLDGSTCLVAVFSSLMYRVVLRSDGSALLLPADSSYAAFLVGDELGDRYTGRGEWQIPVPVHGILTLACGHYHMAMLTRQGLCVIGLNDHGTRGDYGALLDLEVESPTYLEAPEVERWRAVACSKYGTFALSEAGVLYGAGPVPWQLAATKADEFVEDSARDDRLYEKLYGEYSDDDSDNIEETFEDEYIQRGFRELRQLTALPTYWAADAQHALPKLLGVACGEHYVVVWSATALFCFGPGWSGIRTNLLARASSGRMPRVKSVVCSLDVFLVQDDAGGVFGYSRGGAIEVLGVGGLPPFLRAFEISVSSYNENLAVLDARGLLVRGDVALNGSGRLQQWNSVHPLVRTQEHGQLYRVDLRIGYEEPV